MKVIAALLCFVAIASSQLAYTFSDGYIEVLGAEPLQTFNCEGRDYGYYADIGASCQVFHVCVPIIDEEGEVEDTVQYSFFCGNETMFNQEALTCSHASQAFPCELAETLYNISNANFGSVPQRDF